MGQERGEQHHRERRGHQRPWDGGEQAHERRSSGTPAFSLCTFWYVDALGRAGGSTTPGLGSRRSTYANHPGLCSEEAGSTGEQLGNFPRAFSHLALISAAIILDCHLEHRAGFIEAVFSEARRGYGLASTFPCLACRQWCQPRTGDERVPGPRAD